jgi:hypothetical protein
VSETREAGDLFQEIIWSKLPATRIHLILDDKVKASASQMCEIEQSRFASGQAEGECSIASRH